MAGYSLHSAASLARRPLLSSSPLSGPLAAVLLRVLAVVSCASVITEARSPEAAAAASAALAQDDACLASAGQGCALEALQTTRTALGSGAAHQASARQQARGNPTADSNYQHELQADKDQAAEIGIVLDCDSAPCKIRGPANFSGQEAPFDQMFARIGARSPGCKEWNAYFWPQISFWSGQIGRRFRSLDFDDMEGLERARKFAHQASYLVSIIYMDPRKGHAWSEPVQSFFRQVAEAEGPDMPELPEFFRYASRKPDMNGVLVTLAWFKNLACDIDWWQRDMAGSHQNHTDLCWSQVQHPRYGFSPMGLSMVRPEPAWPLDYDPLVHPEYLTCQDSELNSTFFDGLCPFGGHVEHFDGVEHWGLGVPKYAQEEVFQCQNKMGFSGVTDMSDNDISDLLFYDSPGIDLGEEIDDSADPVVNITAEQAAWPQHYNSQVNARWVHEILKVAMTGKP